MTRTPTPLALVAVALAAAAFALSARAQQQPPAGPRYEYRLLTWTPADTEAVLRAVTRQELEGPVDMVRRLVRDEVVVPEQDPTMQRETDLRLTEKLQAAGLEGWEAFWVREATVIVDGVVLPAPSVLLRRRR